MKKQNKTTRIWRIASIGLATVLAIGGVAFAALQSQPLKLSGNTIETATANLQISQDGTNYASSLHGFDFAGVIPGGAPVPTGGYQFILKNGGNAALQLKMAVGSTPSNPDNVDLDKVNVIITPVGGQSQSFSLQSLITANAGGGLTMTTPATLFSGNSQRYSMQISMTADAMSGSSASLGGIDFVFTGIAQ